MSNIYIEVSRTLWRVGKYGGMDWEMCAEQAAVHASLTGSVGASYSVGGDETEESHATVERARSMTTDEYGRIA